MLWTLDTNNFINIDLMIIIIIIRTKIDIFGKASIFHFIYGPKYWIVSNVEYSDYNGGENEEWEIN